MTVRRVSCVPYSLHPATHSSFGDLASSLTALREIFTPAPSINLPKAAAETQPPPPPPDLPLKVTLTYSLLTWAPSAPLSSSADTAIKPL
uniref:Uncharacterized protein n=1 Tax=Knipowitschia caucasica TaxID=637954 RepID=A0AAV2JQ33_KNICA